MNPSSSTSTLRPMARRPRKGTSAPLRQSGSPLFGKRCPNDTDPQNLTDVSIFLLLELSEDPEPQPVVAGLFLSMCLVMVLGNRLIILAVSPDSHLHTPMYFFLSNLSLPDIGFTSTTVPKMIVDIQSHSRVTSYAGCLTQMCLLAISGGMEERHAPECDGL
ncbi:olfactory receptor 7E24-like [Pongo abelii]|uniref:olfactory receptor 7E24-like n=1 Tax=Pongo abelii TaxID=9601 RepID=UPI0023E828DD|nr:olfactory receptor 7E24-like [Pongo abelii]XP_054401956.1 olfactory receptor 7E24-like [Pongo abelii]